MLLAASSNFVFSFSNAATASANALPHSADALSMRSRVSRYVNRLEMIATRATRPMRVPKFIAKSYQNGGPRAPSLSITLVRARNQRTCQIGCVHVREVGQHYGRGSLIEVAYHRGAKALPQPVMLGHTAAVRIAQ